MSEQYTLIIPLNIVIPREARNLLFYFLKSRFLATLGMTNLKKWRSKMRPRQAFDLAANSGYTPSS
jgi:hypothetical protein